MKAERSRRRKWQEKLKLKRDNGQKRGKRN
jgi:hypothetical protein